MATEIKPKINQWDLIKLTGLCTAREIIKEKKNLATYNETRQWEKKLCVHVCVTGTPCCTVGEKKENVIKKFKKNLKRPHMAGRK